MAHTHPAPRAAQADGPFPFWVPAAIFATVLACFWPALSAGFLTSWDDDHMILANPHFRGLSAANLRWMFLEFHVGHWHPLTWISLAVDHALWGMDPRGYHLTNVTLHAANAVLLYLVARLLLGIAGAGGGRRIAVAALAALLFGVHPLRVESVAWVTERRDVLSGFFLLLALHAWLRHRLDPSGRRWLSLAVVAFVLSLLSKAWGITLPAVLLILDAWPLGRLSGAGRVPLLRLLLEKIPFLVPAAGAAVLALLAQRETGAMDVAAHFTPLQIAAQVAFGLCFYVAKTLLPVGLSPIYLIDLELDPTRPIYLACFALVGAGTVGLFVLRRRLPALTAAFACYAIVVSPVLGVAQSGIQMAADRYTYLACIPFALLAAAGVGRPWGLGGGRVATAVALALVAALGLRARAYTLDWRDAPTLWTHAIAVDPENWFAYTQRGTEHANRGDPVGAREDYDAAIAIDPRCHMALENRAIVLLQAGEHEAAFGDLTIAAEEHPACFVTRATRGAAALVLGRHGDAISDLEAALGLRPASAEVRFNLATAQARAGRREEAIANLRRILAEEGAETAIGAAAAGKLRELEGGAERGGG